MSDRPPIVEITDPEALRLLAQPTRLRIQAQLMHGPATSTTLARALGESTGLTSYHLRQMAKHGFVEEVPELSKGRERWWRSTRRDVRFPPPERQTPEMRALMEEMQRLDLAADLEAFARSKAEVEAAGDWEFLPWSRSSILVTEEELKEFFEEFIGLLYRYKRSPDETPPGARPVLTRFLAFPAPRPPVADPGDD